MPDYKGFQKALNKIAADKENADRAYRHMPTIDTVTKSMQQYIFLRNYNKLNPSAFVPITEPSKINRRRQELVGLNYTHDNITETIDFRDTENAKYKDIFEQAYLKMTMHPRLQYKYGDFNVVKGAWVPGPRGGREDNSVYTITTKQNLSEPKDVNDPLDALNTEDAGFVNYLIDDIRKRTKNKKIVLDTNKLLLTKRNEDTNFIEIYTSTADIRADDETKWQKAKMVMSIDPDNAQDIPFDAIYSLPESVWHGKRGRHPDYIQEIDLRPLKNGTSKKLLLTIQDDGMPPTKEKLEEIKRKQEARKMENYELLDKYSRYGADKNEARKLTADYEFKSHGENAHDVMLDHMNWMRKRMEYARPENILAQAKNHNISIHNTDAIAASYMSTDLSALKLFPIYDKSDGQDMWHVPIAIAAINSHDPRQSIYGILRLDDPEAKTIYQTMKEYAENAIKTIQKQQTIPGKPITNKPVNNKPETKATPEQTEMNGLLSKFKASLTDMQRADSYAIGKAYGRAASASINSTSRFTGDRLQRKFLTELDKLTNSPFKPIEKRGEYGVIHMTGIQFAYKDQTYDLDFSQEKFKPFKNAFDNAFLEMTLKQRTEGCYKEIKADMDYNANITVKASGIAGCSSDPLDKNTAKLTARMIQKTVNYTRHPNITIETKKTLLIKPDPKSEDYIIYASNAGPNETEKAKWEQAYPLMRTNKSMPPQGFDIAAIKYTGPAPNGTNKTITEIGFGQRGLQIKESSMKTAQPLRQNRHIPDSQKPDFMRKEFIPEDGPEYN